MSRYLADVISWLQVIMTTPLLHLGGVEITMFWLIKATGLLVFVGLATRGIKSFLKQYFLAKLRINEGDREIISTFVSLGLGAIGLVLVLQGLGLNFQSLVVIMGGLGVGAGFGLKDLIHNLASGMTLLIERKIKAGDLVVFDATEGYVEEISLRSTVIRTFRGSQIVVPNLNLTSHQVENWHYKDYYGRLEITISVARHSDPLLVTEVLLDCAATEPQVVEQPAPRVIFRGMTATSLDFELWVWVERSDRRLMVHSALNYAIHYYLQLRQIPAPIPTYDIALRSPPELWAAVSTPPPSSQPLNPHSVAAFPNPTPENLPIATAAPAPNSPFSPPPSPVPVTSCRPLKDLLRQVQYFAHLNDLQLLHLIEIGRRRLLEPEAILCRQGDPADGFYLVLTGSIAAIYETKRASQKLFTFTSGQYFGELPIMLKLPYPTTMIAQTETTLLMIASDQFNALLQRYPILASDIAQALLERQDILDTHRQYLASSGLLDDQPGTVDPLVWMRDRLQQFLRRH